MTRALSKAGLERLHRALSGHVERGEMHGLVALVSRDEHGHVEQLGTSAFERQTPMRHDTIFRVASLTKPIVAVATMILVEECRIRLDDPIDSWIPELAGRRLLRSIASELDDTVPAIRPISVRDLLAYRMGFRSVMAPRDTYPIQRAIRELRIGCDGAASHAEPGTDEWLRALARRR